MRHLTFSAIFLLFLFINSIVLSSPTEQENVEEKKIDELKVRDCLLPIHHPLQARLNHLFKHPDMFESPEHLRENGFQVIERLDRRLMVASHPKLKNYLIKKFQNEVPCKRQLRNYLSRINGARRLRQFIASHQLKHIVTPKKWLYRLSDLFPDPKKGKRTYVLIVEKIEMCTEEQDLNEEIARRYYHIDFDVLKELCLVVYHFRGLDSALRNMPFTRQNKIAFIDTECWNCEREGFLERVLPFMSQDRQDYALDIFEKLKKQALIVPTSSP
ncbi:MAG: hypothetical protein ACH350_00455 [Parachlamydiaceae bacterium]